jgi:26S proteasome regulatory subunit T5
LAVTDNYATIAGKGVVIKTTTRQTVFLPVTGLLNAAQLKPAELIGVNKDGYMLYEKLPTEYDARGT